MTQEEFFENITKCLDYGNIQGVESNLRILNEEYSPEDAGQLLSFYILKKYTLFRADMLSVVLEKAIRVNRELALVMFPDNFIFRLTMAAGSVELYECFIEEAIEPELIEQGYNKEQEQNYYLKLCETAAAYNSQYATQYHEFRKGVHYNSAMSDPDRLGYVHLSEEDYSEIENIIAVYNKLVGRRKILGDLLKRSGRMG